MKPNNDHMTNQATLSGSVYHLTDTYEDNSTATLVSISAKKSAGMISSEITHTGHAHESNAAFNQALTLGISRNDCEQLLRRHNINSIQFAQWLAIPSLHCLLIFRHHHCVAIETYGF